MRSIRPMRGIKSYGKWLWLWVALWAGALPAATLPQAQNLLSLGLYAGAQEAFEELLRAQPSPGAAKGLLQALLAQGQVAGAQSVLAVSGELLEPNSRAFYGRLTGSSAEEVRPDALAPDEKPWYFYYLGVQAAAQGDYGQADSWWRQVPAEHPACALALGLQGGGAAGGQALEKHLKKMRRQDAALIRNYILGLLARGQLEEARALVEAHHSKLSGFQAGFLRAMSWPAASAQREAAVRALWQQASSTSDMNLLLGLWLKEARVSLADVEQQLGEKRREPLVAIVLAQAWIAKGSLVRAYELLAALRPEGLPQAWRAPYFSTLAYVAAELQPARYREAAAALASWRDLPGTTAGERALIERQVADAYYKNADYKDAAELYQKQMGDNGLPAVLAWLAAGDLEKAAELLSHEKEFKDRDQAVLAYLMQIRKENGSLSLEEVYARVKTPQGSSWPVDYLRIEAQAMEDPAAALRLLNALPMEAYGSQRAQEAFLYQQYQLLLATGQAQEAQALLQRLGSRSSIPRLFAPAVLEYVAQAQPAAQDVWMDKMKELSQADKVALMLVGAQKQGDPVGQLEKIEQAIADLPAAQRPPKLLELAKHWMRAGRLERASAVLAALKESVLAGQLREEEELLNATLAEMQNDPAALGQWLALAQKEATAPRARLHLAAYYARKDQPEKAREIFYQDLAQVVARQGLMPALWRTYREEALRSLLEVARVLPAGDAQRVQAWVEEAVVY